MSFGIPVRNGLGVGLLASTFLSSLRIGGRPAMFLNFIGTDSLDSRVTLTRALNTATRVNSSGAIEIVNANLPRFDYDPATLAPKGLLIEEARTNVALNSVLAGAVTGSPGTAPTSWSASIVGTTSIDAITPSTYAAGNALTISAAAGRAVYFQSQTLLASTTYTFSMDVNLTAGTTVINQVIFINAPPAGSTVTYTLDGVAATSTTVIPSGVHRLTTTIAVSVTPGVVSIRFGLGLQSNATATVKIYNIQFEVGAFATSYIPTTTLAVLRNADVAQMTGTNFSSWFNPVEGTLFANFVPTNSIASNTRGATISNGVNRVVDIYIDVTVWRSFNGTTNVTPASSTAVLNSAVNFASAYKSGDYAASMNGGAVGTAATAGVQSANKLTIGTNITNSAGFLNGHIRRITYYNTRLPNATLQVLTA